MSHNAKCAANGADAYQETREGQHGYSCALCGTWVRADLVDDPFFGFKAGCEVENKEPNKCT